MSVPGGRHGSALLDGLQERQDALAHLGELDTEGRVAARHLAESFVGVSRQPGLFEGDAPTEAIRSQAHILVCFLAYALRKTLEGWSKRAGLGSSITTIMEEFARINSSDMKLLTTDGRMLHIRCVVRPGDAQSILLDRLGLDLPRRLHLPKGLNQMVCQLLPTAPCKTKT